MSGPSVFPSALTLEEIARNIADVRRRIEAACSRSGRDSHSVRLLPVSKTVDDERIRLAYAAGCRFLGENKVQEAIRKYEALSDLSDLKWSIIGHLQTNKAKLVARFATEFQALDTLRVADALDRRLQAEGRALDVLVQVNTSGEESKYGLRPENLAQFVRQLPVYSSLRVRGLMTLAEFTSDTERVRECFVKLRSLQTMLRDSAQEGASFDELSMGMSGDFEAAIEEGATVVRVGQAIFGARSIPDSHYWPAGAASAGDER